MSYFTHKHILGVGGSISNPQEAWKDGEMSKVFQGISVLHENISPKKVLLISKPPYIKEEISISIE